MSLSDEQAPDAILLLPHLLRDRDGVPLLTASASKRCRTIAMSPTIDTV
jgi:hypothetical protein